MSGATVKDLYDRLHDALGPQGWWPGDTPWEIACGAVLTQNTNWTNVERAITNLVESSKLDAAAILAMELPELANLIRPAGYFNLKAKRLQNLARWWVDRGAPNGVENLPFKDLRNDLLSVNGVGQETADSILLYALDRTTFVVDAYTKRFASRHGLIDSDADYGTIKRFFESKLDADRATFNEYHALIVAVGKTWCRPKPQCTGCPLEPLLNGHAVE